MSSHSWLGYVFERCMVSARWQGAAGAAFKEYGKVWWVLTREQIRIFKGMLPAQKLELGARFCFAARHLKAQALRAQHPEWPEDRIVKRVKELFLYAAG